MLWFWEEMKIIPVSLSFLIFLSLGSAHAKAIWAENGKISTSDSPVTRVRWANDDNNPRIIAGPTYHLMISDPAQIDARAQNFIHSVHATDASLKRTDPNPANPNPLDVADRPIHLQSRSYRFGRRRSSPLSFASNPRVGESSINPRSSLGASGIVSTPRFGGGSGRVV